MKTVSTPIKYFTFPIYSWPSNSGNGDSQSQPAWPSSTSENLGSGSTGGNTTPIPCNDPDEIITNVNINSTYNSKNNVQNDQGSNEKVKIRPPPPLLAKGTPPRNSVGKAANKRPELEVRKDLTLPTAPTAREDNVFQVFSFDEIFFWQLDFNFTKKKFFSSFRPMKIYLTS